MLAPGALESMVDAIVGKITEWAAEDRAAWDGDGQHAGEASKM